MNDTPIIYGSIISPYVRKVLMTLNIKKVPYEHKPMNPFDEADKKFLLTLNPLGKVPIYQEGDFVLSDSSAICAYLERKIPQPAIYPKNNHDYAHSLWLEEYADTQLFPALITVFFNTVLAPIFNMTSNHQAVETTIQTTLPHIFDYLDEVIGNKKMLVSDQISIADISIGQLAMIKFDIIGVEIDISKWKRLSLYIDNIANNELFKNLFMIAAERVNKIRHR